MSADTLTISLTGPLAEEVRAAAEARGLTPEEYIRQQAALGVAKDSAAAQFDDDDIDEDVAAAADFERTRVGVPWDEVRAWMQSWGSANELPRPKPRQIR